MHRFEPKSHLTLLYKDYAKKNNAKIRANNVPNTTLQKLCQQKEKNAQIHAQKAPKTP